MSLSSLRRELRLQECYPRNPYVPRMANISERNVSAGDIRIVFYEHPELGRMVECVIGLYYDEGSIKQYRLYTSEFIRVSDYH